MSRRASALCFAAVTRAAAHAHEPPALVACMQMTVITMAASVEEPRPSTLHGAPARPPSTIVPQAKSNGRFVMVYTEDFRQL